MANSQITVRVPDPVKVLWKELADREGRSMSNYLERLLLREKERIENGSITLDTLYVKLDKVLDCISENKKRASNGKERKESPHDAWEDCGVCTKESWDQWIDHLRKLGKPPNYYRAEKLFGTLCEIRQEDWDCDLLIAYLIGKGHATFYVPHEWREAEGRR